ncbi:DNA primase small subunit isoform X2 [Eurosta solidaginis]|uniref:DNA primase small subunit isoform X2 n=1 Tax=Eurosta solidaginis TaxID=178769 RepID=UPI003530EB4D
MPEQIASQEKMPVYDPNILADMLPVYYKRLFPHKPFYRWLSYGLSESGIFSNREFSYTLHDDIYVRNRCYDTQSELESDICSTCPHKIDIGAVMNTKPKNFRIATTAMQPVQRELVFDIDMDDYNEVRTCCTGSTICLKCWKFMALASRLIDTALREDFGFEHILWVFSGRRGVHGWVCDHTARHLDSKGRSAVAEYLQVSTNISINGAVIARVQVGERMHHSVRRALQYVEPLFEEIVLEDQNLFGNAKGVTKLLMMIPDEIARNDAEAYLKKTNQDGAHSRIVWASFVRYANSMRTGGAQNIWTRRLKHIIEEIQLGVLYPRLDINVTKDEYNCLITPNISTHIINQQFSEFWISR